MFVEGRPHFIVVTKMIFREGLGYQRGNDNLVQVLELTIGKHIIFCYEKEPVLAEMVSLYVYLNLIFHLYSNISTIIDIDPLS